jgi:hypothetical protein
LSPAAKDGEQARSLMRAVAAVAQIGVVDDGGDFF